ncbi:MAG TPA: TIGR01777 family protein [Flavobacteriia bacterium]|nr:TIGR01777 family protein [Flavobacteriia bacterium]
MKIKQNLIIAGGTGYLGNLLINHFKKDFNIFILTRKESKTKNGIQYLNWDSNWKYHVESSTVIINLAGKSINCLFTKKNKKELLNSRIHATRQINEVIKNLKTPPKLFINASGISIYKETYKTDYDEYHYQYGTDFLSRLSQEWEAEFYRIRIPNTRKVAIRLAPVLGEESQAIKSLLPIVKLGLGGKQGSGKQLFPFVHQTDFIRAVTYIIKNEKIENSVNLIAPTPTTNAKFTQVFRHILHIPIGIPTPAFLLHISKYFTNVEPEIVLTSIFAKPKKLLENGFVFQFPNIEKTLDDILKNN